jgi:hypothetical protein
MGRQLLVTSTNTWSWERISMLRRRPTWTRRSGGKKWRGGPWFECGHTEAGVRGGGPVQYVVHGWRGGGPAGVDRTDEAKAAAYQWSRRCGDRGPVRGKERENGPGPKKIVQFFNYSNIFKMTRIDSIKRWSSSLGKISSKICICRELNNEQLSL